MGAVQAMRGTLIRVLRRREMNADPVDSLSRLQHAAELRVVGGENSERQQEERICHDRSIPRTSG